MLLSGRCASSCRRLDAALATYEQSDQALRKAALDVVSDATGQSSEPPFDRINDAMNDLMRRYREAHDRAP